MAEYKVHFLVYNKSKYANCNKENTLLFLTFSMLQTIYIAYKSVLLPLIYSSIISDKKPLLSSVDVLR
jgi:hypothetical protein